MDDNKKPRTAKEIRERAEDYSIVASVMSKDPKLARDALSEETRSALADIGAAVQEEQLSGQMSFFADDADEITEAARQVVSAGKEAAAEMSKEMSSILTAMDKNLSDGLAYMSTAMQELSSFITTYQKAYSVIRTDDGLALVADIISDNDLRKIGISPLAFRRAKEKETDCCIELLKTVNFFVLVTLVDNLIKEGKIQPIEEDLNLQLFTEGIRTGEKTQTQSKKKQAEQLGAFTQLIPNQALITNKKFHNALFAQKNDAAYITLFDQDFIKTLAFDDQGALTTTVGVDKTEMDRQIAQGLKDSDIFQSDILIQIYSTMYKMPEDLRKEKFRIYLPSLCKAMGIDQRVRDKKNGDRNGTMKLLESLMFFDRCIGVIGKNSFYKLLTFNGYDEETNTIELSSPYMYKIMQSIASDSHRISTKGKEYDLPSHSFLVHADIVSERNKPAVFLVYRIIQGLQQRGTKPDADLKQNKGSHARGTTVTYRVSFRTLVNDVPMLADRLNATKQSNDKTKVLKRAFDKAIELLEKKTDIKLYYTDLEINYFPPTVGTLDNFIMIRHRGKNILYSGDSSPFEDEMPQ